MDAAFARASWKVSALTTNVSMYASVLTSADGKIVQRKHQRHPQRIDEVK